MKLRVYIISFFFLGGLIGGYLYSRMGLGLDTLIFGAVILIVSLFFDGLKYKVIRNRRKYQQRKTAQLSQQPVSK